MFFRDTNPAPPSAFSCGVNGPYFRQYICWQFTNTMALESLRPGKTFLSWDEVEKFLKELETVNFFPLRFEDTKTIGSYNKAVRQKCMISNDLKLNHLFIWFHLKGPKLDEKWRFKHATVVCKHYGKPISRSTTNTWPNQNQYECECPFKYRLVFDPVMENFVVQPRGFNNTHSDKHPLSAEHIKLYHCFE